MIKYLRRYQWSLRDCRQCVPKGRTLTCCLICSNSCNSFVMKAGSNFIMDANYELLVWLEHHADRVNRQFYKKDLLYWQLQFCNPTVINGESNQNLVTICLSFSFFHQMYWTILWLLETISATLPAEQHFQLLYSTCLWFSCLYFGELSLILIFLCIHCYWKQWPLVMAPLAIFLTDYCNIFFSSLFILLIQDQSH